MQIELDLAGILAQGLEMPLTVQVAEGPLNQRHLHARGRRMGILSSEALADAVVIDLNGRHQPVRRPLPDLDPTAPRQKRRVILDPVDQGEHLLGAVSEQYGFMNNCHDAI